MQLPDSDIFSQFLAAIQDDDDDAAEALVASLRSEHVPALIELVEADDLDIRWWAVRSLAACDEQIAVPAVASRLNDDDAGVRSVAVLALGHLFSRHPQGVGQHLANMASLVADEVGLVRQTAVEALAMCGDAAVPVLGDVLAGTHEGARTRAVLALRKIGSIRAAPMLFGALNDPNYLVSAIAYEALEEMGLLENVLVAPQ